MRLELGPCHINSSYKSYLNPHSWNEVSNLLFLSQPLGVGRFLFLVGWTLLIDCAQASRMQILSPAQSTPLPAAWRMPPLLVSRAGTQ